MATRSKPKNSHPLSWWLVVVAGGLVVIFSIAIVRELVRTRQIRNQLATLQTDITNEQKRHDQLKELLTYLSSPTFQEREARLQLGLKKSGERVIVVPANDDANSIDTSLGETATAPSNQNIASKWWEYFFPKDLHKS